MDVVRESDAYRLVFDMNPRIVNRVLAHDPEGDDRKNWIFSRYLVADGTDAAVSRGFRTTPAAQVMWGPLVLAKSLHVGATRELVARVCPCGRFGRRGSPLVARVSP